MKEDFLHYLWKFRRFDALNLQTCNNEPLQILHPGQYLQLAGPDFFNAQIIIGDQKWAGNIEIHVKSSDWYLHQHEKDPAYDNVILHVVWEHDTEIFRINNIEIPVLQIKSYVADDILNSYDKLMFPKSWIYCEKQLTGFDNFILKNWLERLFFERLERKSIEIRNLLTQTGSDWEAVLFCMLARNFGLNTNGESFLQIAQSLPFSIVRKEGFECANVEALLFGRSGLLDAEKQDHYFLGLKSRFDYLSHKYQLEKIGITPVQFFKHRPDNFPTIRLSQLAVLYSQRQNLFSKITEAVTLKEMYKIFEVTASDYWHSHYQFDKISPAKSKALSKGFIDLIVINTIVPIRFAFAKNNGTETVEDLVSLLREVAPEKNAVTDKFRSFGIAAENALETQSLIQLKTDYCNRGKCMDCVIGTQLIQQT